jgi:hypothetical protein
MSCVALEEALESIFYMNRFGPTLFSHFMYNISAQFYFGNGFYELVLDVIFGK